MQINTAAGAVPDIAALIADELTSLAADAQTLAARVSPGDVLSAVVLPSNGLTDLLDIGGLRVAAELPPTLLPGETIRVAVTGFDGDRINLQILPQPPAAAAESLPASESVVPPPAAPRAGGKTGLARAAVSGAGSKASAAPGAARPVRVSPDAPPATGAVNRPAFAASAALRPAPAAPAPPRSPDAAARATAEFETMEARLAAAHAVNPDARPAPPSARASAPAAPSGGRAAAPAPRVPNRAPLPAAAARASVPAAPAVARPIIPMRPVPGPAPAPVAAIAPPARSISALREPEALLRALRLPVTASNVAAARMALDTPEKLPNALSVLERALANSTDPRVATLSTLASFVGRLDPRSPVFAAQIAAFAEHVVTGPEAKIAGFAAAVDGDGRNPSPADTDAAAPASAAQERAAVLRAALDFDLKTQLLASSASSDPGRAAAPALERAVVGALTALTAVQLGAAAALASNPDGLAFSLPIALPDGSARAHIRISPDAPERRGAPLDGDNFHIAFVLETRHLGTVAIELMTVGRAVTCSVKTEAALAQRAFAEALGGLTARLRSLNYTVAKADAVVAPAAAALSAEDAPEPSAAPAAGNARLVDTDA